MSRSTYCNPRVKDCSNNNNKYILKRCKNEKILYKHFKTLLSFVGNHQNTEKLEFREGQQGGSGTCYQARGPEFAQRWWRKKNYHRCSLYPYIWHSM